MLIALAFAGCGRAGPDPPAPWFEEVARSRGLVFEYRSGHAKRYLFPEIMGGGAALFDMDGDGDLDAYLVQGGSLTGPRAAQPGNRLFRNRGDGTFEDATAGSGAEDGGYGMGVAAGDYDNDGDVDLYVTHVGPNLLLRNEGGGRFVDVTSRAGVGHPGWTTSAAFVDYDRDGDLDLFAANYVRWSPQADIECFNNLQQPDYCSPRTYQAPAMDVLYRNDGDGRFTDVTEALGLGAAFGNGLGVAAADFDGDGWPDLFVANDGTLNQLWINQQGRGFVDQALLRGCASDQEGLAKAGMGVSVADIDDDLDLDLLIGNLNAESDSLFRNSGRFFSDATAGAGLGLASRSFTRFGLGWIDFDNDGRLDLFEANGRVMMQASSVGPDPFAEPSLVFQATAEGRFVERLPRGGTAAPLAATSRAAAFGDVDNDGGVDILVVNRDAPAYLLHNVVAPRGHWIAFRVLEEHGRDAEGAQLVLSVAGHRRRRDVRAGYSYCASNDPRVHVGLGAATRVDDVSVRWVDGELESFGAFDADRIVELRRGRR